MALHPPTDGMPFVEMASKILAINAGHDMEWLKKETTLLSEKIAKANNTFDELCWFLAEADLVLRNKYALYVEKKISSQSLAMPTENNIRLLAEAISEYHNNLEDLHWQLAERQILTEMIKTS